MADINFTAPITFRRPSIPSLKFPKLGIGQALTEVLKSVGHAFDLAYVQPYHPSRSQSPVILEGEEKGRNPNW